MPASRDAPRADAARAAPAEWSALLAEAVNKPGVISSAYSRFWDYSVGNQLLAWCQCTLRGLEPGPINTFPGWLRLGRHVRKGEKAITLCMPITLKRKRDPPHPIESSDPDADSEADVQFTRFLYKPHWFVLCQTDGDAFTPPPIPQWDERTALEALRVERVPFKHTNGNVQGYASGRHVAISPIAQLPHKTLFHEIAHVLLGHTKELHNFVDGQERTPVNIREAEAESVALICCESLSLDGGEFCRGYIQHWLGKEPIPDRNAQRIFKAADTILRAGRGKHLGHDARGEKRAPPIQAGRCV
jgi:antirestriction protein ArdC